MSCPVTLSEYDPKTVWNNIIEKLKVDLPRQSYLTWFKPLKAVSYDGKKLTLRVPSRFYYDWIEGHYSGHLRQAVADILGEKVEVSYTVEPNCREIVEEENIYSHDKVGLSAVTRDDFDTRLSSRYTFDNFVEGDCNRFARAASIALAENPGKTPFNPLMIYGGPGLGKTHLIQAIGNYIYRNNIARRVLYVTSENFTADFVEMIRSGRSNNFSRMYRSVDVLLLDDVQFFMEREKTQEEFFHTFNSLHHAGKQLVFSSDRPPRELDGFDERLVSRLQWGLVSELKKPEYETRLAILKRRASQENIELVDEVAHFLAIHITDNIRNLEGALIQILAQSSLLGLQISINLARKVLKDLVDRPIQNISIDRIQEITAEEFRIPSDLLRSKTRKREVVEARQIAIYLCTELTPLTLKAIGLHFGGRDHATVIHSRETICERIKGNPRVAEIVEKLRRKIELASI